MKTAYGNEITGPLPATPYRLRSGEWGAKVRHGSVREGDPIQITTRSGKTWVAVVAKVVWQGEDVALVATGETTRARSGGGGSHRSYGMCESCGERRATTEATDGSGIVGRVCGLCARDPMSVSFG